jgi:serine/threonine protein kinase
MITIITLVYLITDLAFGGELFDRICKRGSYYESDAVEVVKTTLSAVCYLHQNGIVHRDLKPENLLFRSPAEDSDLLLADFGLSRIIDEEQMHVLTTTCGTPGYMAPEIFKKNGHGKPVDMWALGVITYFLLCGYTPFDRDTSVEEMKAIMEGDYSFEPAEYWEDISEHAKDFIRRCLTVNPADRLSSASASQHAFLTQKFAKSEANLLPAVRKNFNARKLFGAAITAVKAMNSMKNGGAMNGMLSLSPQTAKSVSLNPDCPLDPVGSVSRQASGRSQQRAEGSGASGGGLWSRSSG